LAGAAADGRLLTTKVVRDLVAGSGIRFDPAVLDGTAPVPEVLEVLAVDRASLH
jgi:hypothetical protein